MRCQGSAGDGDAKGRGAAGNSTVTVRPHRAWRARGDPPRNSDVPGSWAARFTTLYGTACPRGNPLPFVTPCATLAAHHRPVSSGRLPWIGTRCAARVAFQKGLVRTTHAHPARQQVPLPSRRGRGLHARRRRPPASGRARGGALGDGPPGQPAGLPLADTFATNVELEPAPAGSSAGVAASAGCCGHRQAAGAWPRALDRFGPDVVHLHNIYHQLSPSILRPVARAGHPVGDDPARLQARLPDLPAARPRGDLRALRRGGPLNAVRERCKSGSLAASGVLALESGVHRRLHAYDQVDRFVSPSRFLRDVMLRAGISPERIVTLANVASVPQVEAWDRPRPAGRVGEARYLFAGRLSPEKGVDTLVRALAVAPDGVRLDIAGDGPSRAELELLAAAEAPGRVPFHGRLDKPALAELIRGARAMVVPSRWYENQPMTVLESFAAATPVVATSLGGLPELVRDGIEGRVVPPNDPQALARVLSELADDPATARRMGERARQRFTTEFSGEVHLAGLADVYDEARRAAVRGRADTDDGGLSHRRSHRATRAGPVVPQCCRPRTCGLHRGDGAKRQHARQQCRGSAARLPLGRRAALHLGSRRGGEPPVRMRTALRRLPLLDGRHGRRGRRPLPPRGGRRGGTDRRSPQGQARADHGAQPGSGPA